MKEHSLLSWSVRRKAIVVAVGTLAFCGAAVGAVVEPIAMHGALTIPSLEISQLPAMLELSV